MPQSHGRSLAPSDNSPAYNIPGGKNYLLVIGIDEYKNGIPPLYNAVHDAQAFRDVLWAKYQFDPAHTFKLFNHEATRSAISNTFYKLIEQMSSEDNLLFYFSGHGELHRSTKRGFWIPVDAREGDPSTYLNNLEVIDFLRNIKARHVFGIVDSCFSAALFAQRSVDAVTQRQYSIPSRWLLTAGRLERVSDGSLGQHSPFAESLLKQLQYQEEPALWVSSLCHKVLRGVAFNSKKQMPRGEPLQDTGHQGGEFVFLRKGQDAATVILSGNQEAEISAIIPPPFIPASEQKETIRWLKRWGIYHLVALGVLLPVALLSSHRIVNQLVLALIPFVFYLAPFYSTAFSRLSRKRLWILTGAHALVYYAILLVYLRPDSSFEAYPWWQYALALVVGLALYYLLIPLINQKEK